jgi:hypothetical protein
MGAPWSHQRTWADYEFFYCFHSMSRKPWKGFARLFHPCTLVRTWGAHRGRLSPNLFVLTLRAAGEPLLGMTVLHVKN